VVSFAVSAAAVSALSAAAAAAAAVSDLSAAAAAAAAHPPLEDPLHSCLHLLLVRQGQHPRRGSAAFLLEQHPEQQGSLQEEGGCCPPSHLRAFM